jgi:hypothetical protein
MFEIRRGMARDASNPEVIDLENHEPKNAIPVHRKKKQP